MTIRGREMGYSRDIILNKLCIPANVGFYNQTTDTTNTKSIKATFVKMAEKKSSFIHL